MWRFKKKLFGQLQVHFYKNKNPTVLLSLLVFDI